jgi:hypothetical protein
MTINTTFLVIIATIGLAFIVFLFLKNQKDRKELTRKLNNDYKKTKDEENENDIDTSNDR